MLFGEENLINTLRNLRPQRSNAYVKTKYLNPQRLGIPNTRVGIITYTAPFQPGSYTQNPKPQTQHIPKRRSKVETRKLERHYPRTLRV